MFDEGMGGSVYTIEELHLTNIANSKIKFEMDLDLSALRSRRIYHSVIPENDFSLRRT